jgi:cobalt-zinc-cadmium resistance protein CzcA
MKKIIDFLLDNRWLVGGMLLAVVVAGIAVMLQLPIEAFPDLTNNQVVVTVQCPGLSPVEVEQLVTYPIETSLMGMPDLQTVRSTSKLDLSMVTVIFDDSANRYLVRQLVSERLNQIQSRIPAGLHPEIGPMATAFGEVYQYTVDAPKMSLMQVKTLHDWVIRYQLMTIEGVSEVNSWGGETKQYTVVVDPESLRRYNLTLHQVETAIAENNANFGGSYIEHGEQEYTIRGIGRTESLDDLGKIVVTTTGGTPVYVKDIAQLKYEPIPRYGAIMRDGKGETVSGEVIILRGSNGDRIIKEVKQKVAEMKLPDGAKILPFYDQSDVIDATTHTLKKNLIEAAFLVLVILLIFLGDWRAALVVAATIPLALLFAFLGMEVFGISVNLMSLGAIDFGTIVDGSVVMVENCMHRLEKSDGQTPLLDVIRGAAAEVARPIIFGVAIIIAVYLPILTLQSLEGRMFRPMALTVISALTGSLFLALFVVPALCTIALKHRAKVLAEEKGKQAQGEKKQGWFDRLRGHYTNSLEDARKHQRLIFIVAGVAIVVALGSLKFIGTEFMPKLDEGSLVITSKKLPGISLHESILIQDEIERIIMSFPEVKSVVSKMGRPDLATEAMGVYETDAYLTFTSKVQNESIAKRQPLYDRLQAALGKIPGVSYEFTQPMEMRMDETITGTRGDLALKIFAPENGGSLETLEQLGHQAQAIIAGVKGASETQMELIEGSEELQIQLDRASIARYGLNVSDIQEDIQALYGGRQVSEMLLGEERFPIAIRLPEAYRNDPDNLRSLEIRTPQGEPVRLDQVARIVEVRGPVVINRENARRRAVVNSNVEGTDLGSFVRAAEAAVTSGMKLPSGYHFEWGGQYENQQRAQKRLLIVFPVSVLLISALLYATFRNLKQMALILLIVPFALVGGIAALWIRGIDLNLSACVGFIALFGVAVLDGIVMMSHINSLREQGKEMDQAVREGASDRLRPVLITALVASLGFIPMALSTTRGAEVQRPLATVVIGGLITATVLTLYLLPLLYPRFSTDQNTRASSPNSDG